VRRALDAATVAADTAGALAEHDAGTDAALGGLAPSQPPVPALLTAVPEQVAHARAELDRRDRRDDGPAPVKKDKEAPAPAGELPRR